jgi:hypothetical protein
MFILLPGKSDDIYRHCISSITSLCTQHGFQFNPKVAHTDFEQAVMRVMKEFFPDITIKCCRFHLAQAWWRKIQKIGLSSEYKNTESEVGNWLKSLFGIAFLSPEEVEDSFAEDYMAVAPEDQKCIEFADYLTETYVTQESLPPPSLNLG